MHVVMGKCVHGTCSLGCVVQDENIQTYGRGGEAEYMCTAVDMLMQNTMDIHGCYYCCIYCRGVYDELVERGSTQGTSQQFELGCGNIAGCSVIVSLEDAAAQVGFCTYDI